jgi:16S rRNA C967 or C1407 C5-methylase (RsmB/RsmF family)
MFHILGFVDTVKVMNMDLVYSCCSRKFIENYKKIKQFFLAYNTLKIEAYEYSR